VSAIYKLPFVKAKPPTNKKPPAWEAFFLFFYSAFWFSSIAPRHARRQAKEKEEKSKEASLSLHFELHEAT
jgi:hypothetical protein